MPDVSGAPGLAGTEVALGSSLVRLELNGVVAQLTLARPDKLNALTPAMIEALEEAVEVLEDRGEVRVAILTGEGERAFCVGADIGAWSALEPLDMWRRWIREGHRVFDRLARLRQPLIAVVNGHALGGGLELAATADLRIVETHARLGLPEAGIGTIPGWSGTQRLVRRVGPQVVKRLALTGEPVSAQEALRLGLADELCATGGGLSRAFEIARSIAGRAPVSVELAKQLINAAEGEETALALEGIAGALAAFTEDGREGVASFREKRPAQFRNR
jgi:enoyl-CoA hydratase/carnithine racemase